jgi:hypothetical protein
LVRAGGSSGKRGRKFRGNLQSYIESQQTELNSVRRRACSFPLAGGLCGGKRQCANGGLVGSLCNVAQRGGSSGVGLLLLVTEHPVKEKLCTKEGLVVFPRGRIRSEQSAGTLLLLEWGRHV